MPQMPRESNVVGLPESAVLRSVEGVNAQQTLAFRELLAAWNRREDARAQKNFQVLASSRADLEDARTRMHLSMPPR